MTIAHTSNQGASDGKSDAPTIVCTACDGAGPYSEDGCVECVSTGYELTDDQWKLEYARWERRTFGPAVWSDR